MKRTTLWIIVIVIVIITWLSKLITTDTYMIIAVMAIFWLNNKAT